MNAILATSTVQQQLENALNTDHVPDEERRRAAQLLKRLQSTVQVVLIGRPGSGKSRLINLLVGTTVVPGGVDLPPLEVKYGANLGTVYLMADGSEQYHEGLRLDHPAPKETAIVRAELPLPTLTRLSLSEVCLEGALSDQKIMAEWAMNRADIVLWCSQTFDATERALWSSAGETLKGHSFLVLTKADQLQMKGVLAARLEHLNNSVADGFSRVLPVATIQGISASQPDGARDDKIWTASGGKTLMDAIMHLVSTGRRADADNAMIFLRRNAHRIPASTSLPAVKNEIPNLSQKPDPLAQGAPNLTVFHQALDFLQQRADQMVRGLKGAQGGRPEFVLNHCLETTNALTEIIMDDNANNPPPAGIQDDIMECGDMIVLYQLENTQDAAMDAVTLLLQLKKELAVAISA